MGQTHKKFVTDRINVCDNIPTQTSDYNCNETNISHSVLSLQPNWEKVQVWTFCIKIYMMWSIAKY